jgi:hypothetical protein
MRSGAHPDFPNIATYNHKRTIGLIDPVNTIYDGIHPEPLWDSQLPYLTGPVMLVRFLTFWGGILMTAIGLKYVSNFYLNQYYAAQTCENETISNREWHRQLIERKSFERPSPLGHTQTLGNLGRHSRKDHFNYRFYKV